MSSSVIITTYKRPDFLLRAVESVLAQTVRSEVIIVDDNGLGTSAQIQTQEVLKDFLNAVVYLPLEKNGGACVARNKGVEAASGEYIFFLDDDDEFSLNKVEVQTKFLNENPQLDGCLSAFTRIGNDGKEILSEANFPVVGSFKNFVINGNFFTPMLCVKRDSLINIGGFDDIPRFQDRYLMIKALEKDLRFGCIREPLHFMYEHSGERVTETNVNMSRLAITMIRKKILPYKSQFDQKEWQQYEVRDLRMIGTFYYISRRYNTRLQGFPFFIKSFLLSNSKKDVIAALKCIIKVS